MRSCLRSTAVFITRRPPLTSVVALGLCLVGLSAVGAAANPSITEKRARAVAIVEDVRLLDEAVGAAAERFNGANYELAQLTDRLDQTRRELTAARRLNAISGRRIAARLRALYLNGEGFSTIEVLLGARSLEEVLERVDVAERVTQQDTRLANEAKALRTRVANTERELSSARARQAIAVEQRAAETRAIEAKLSERQALLASVQEEIARSEVAEQRRQATLRRQAQLELERLQAEAAAAERARVQALAAAQSSSGSPSTDADSPAVSDDHTAAPSYSPPPADADRGAQVVAIAMGYLGIPYVWAGASPSAGFDCSGLTMYVFAQVGISLPHFAAAQYGMGAPVAREDLEPGDLVFFRDLGHMGMYIGDGNFIHAPRTGDVVKISSLSESYYAENWVGARRVL